MTSSAYNASKGAVLIVNKSTAIQYASENIRANSDRPGLVDSPMTCAHHDNPNIAQGRVAEMPLCRMGQPEDIAVRMSAPRSRFGGTLTTVGQAGGE